MPSEKLAQISALYKKIEDMQDLIKKVDELKKTASGSGMGATMAKAMLPQMSQRAQDAIKVISTAKADLETLSKAADLIRNVPLGTTGDQVGKRIDDFIAKYGNKKFEFVKTGTKSFKVPIFTGCTGKIGFGITLKAELKSERKNLVIKSKASFDSSANVEVGISLGFDLPFGLGDCSITGGISAWASLTGEASIILQAEGLDFSAIMNPAKLEALAGASLFLDAPSIIPNKVLSYIPSLLSSLSVSGKRISYPLGKIKLLYIKTPGYTFTFSLTKGSFSYSGAQGEFVCEVHPDVKAAVEKIKKAILDACDAVLDAINPVNWDLNPFD